MSGWPGVPLSAFSRVRLCAASLHYAANAVGAKRSFTGLPRFCLQPRYRSVVSTEECPSRNWICSSSPPELWQSRAHVRRRSCGATCSISPVLHRLLTTCQTTFSLIPSPHTFPDRLIARNTRPLVMRAADVQKSTASLTHFGIGTVRI